MSDRLTQLQDAVDQVGDWPPRFLTVYGTFLTNPKLAQQFVAALHFVHRRHNLETLGPGDKIRDVKQEQDQKEGRGSSCTLSGASFPD